jgi:CheY-like chemotaxis protein
MITENEEKTTLAINILLVEDNEDDILITKRAFKKTEEFTGQLHAVTDGKQALDFIQGEGEYSNRDEYPLPQLVLLDINLPKITGLEVLETLKNNPAYRSIPCIMLTSSEHNEDIDTSYKLGASGYIQKPLSFIKFTQAVNDMIHYWNINKLPSI